MVCSLTQIPVTTKSTITSCPVKLKLIYLCYYNKVCEVGWWIKTRSFFSHQCVGHRLQNQWTSGFYCLVRATRCWVSLMSGLRFLCICKQSWSFFRWSQQNQTAKKLTKPKLVNKVIGCDLWAKEKGLKTTAIYTRERKREDDSTGQQRWHYPHLQNIEETLVSI